MSVKIRVQEGEPFAEALARFRKVVRRFGPPGTYWKRPKNHKNQLSYFLKHCQRRRNAKNRRKRAIALGVVGDGREQYRRQVNQERIIMGLIRKPV